MLLTYLNPLLQLVPQRKAIWREVKSHVLQFLSF